MLFPHAKSCQAFAFDAVLSFEEDLSTNPMFTLPVGNTFNMIDHEKALMKLRQEWISDGKFSISYISWQQTLRNIKLFVSYGYIPNPKNTGNVALSGEIIVRRKVQLQLPIPFPGITLLTKAGGLKGYLTTYLKGYAHADVTLNATISFYYGWSGKLK